MNPIHYELFDQPQKMHVNVPEGIKKFSFANVHRWEDLSVTGPTYPFNSNVEVVAKAKVPIGDEVAVYYMDALALGSDFYNSGMPAYTIGFNHSQLEDGFVYPPKPELTAERVKKLEIIMEEAAEQPSPELAALPTTLLDYREEPTKWSEVRSTYVAYEDGPRLFIFDESMFVHDYSGRRSDKEVFANDAVKIAGTVIIEGESYGVPVGAIKNSLGYAIPMSNLISDRELHKELHGEQEPLPMRLGSPNPRLSFSERYVTVPLAKAISQTSRLKMHLSKNKNKEK
jgi:hypothetical protein